MPLPLVWVDRNRAEAVPARIRRHDRVEWLYESTDIICFLKQRFGH